MPHLHNEAAEICPNPPKTRAQTSTKYALYRKCYPAEIAGSASNFSCWEKLLHKSIDFAVNLGLNIDNKQKDIRET